MSRAMEARRPLFALLALLLLAAPAAAAQSGPLAGLDAYVEKALRDWNVPGVSVAVIKDDAVVHARGYGLRDFRGQARVDEHTIFAIGSTTKAFVAAGLGMLVDEGLVDWNDRVVDRLPGFQLYDPYVTREIRVRDLLFHSSGLPRGDAIWSGTPYGRQEILERVRHLRPSWSFRSNYGYQNIMFLAAGMVIEEITGQTWDDFTAERIFRPLGMRRSSTSTLGLAAQDNVAAPHIRRDGALLTVPYRNLDNIGPAGSINSSAREMAEWLRLNLANGSHGGRELVSRASIREIQTPQIVTRRGEDAAALYPETNITAYALAWSVQDYHGRKLLAHGGGIDGMRAQVAIVPQEGLGVVVLSNIGGSAFPIAIIHRVLDLYLAPGSDKDWSELLLAREREQERRTRERWAETEAARVAGTRPSRPLAEYAGTFRDDYYGDVEVRHEGDRLAMVFAGAFRASLEHWHFDTFRIRWDDPTRSIPFVSFRLDTAGKVATVSLENLADFHRVRDPAVAVGLVRAPRPAARVVAPVPR